MEDLFKTYGIPAVIAAIVSAIINFRMNNRLALRKELNDEITVFSKKIREIKDISVCYWMMDGRDESKETSIIIKIKEGRKDLLYILDKIKSQNQRPFLLQYSDFWEVITSGEFQSNHKIKDSNKVMSIIEIAEDIITDVRFAFTDKY